jgi:hypothetical protein
MRALFVAPAAFLAALALPSAASATTVISTGSYAAGDSVGVDGSINLGAGTYRFTLALTGAAEGVEGEVTKLTNYVDYCDMDGSGAASYCGSDDFPTSPLLEAVSPTVYQALLTVDAPYTVHYSGVDRTDYTDSCCTYNFDFQAITGGTYSFSFAAVPEPATWMMMVLGFGLLGAAKRRRRVTARGLG